MLNYSSEKKNLKKKQFHSNYDKCLFVMIKCFDKSGVVIFELNLAHFLGVVLHFVRALLLRLNKGEKNRGLTNESWLNSEDRDH